MSRLPANESVVAVPEHVRMGPAMSELNDSQQQFVWSLFECNGDEGAAAERAGYGGNANARRVAVFRLMHNEKVLAAIKEASLSRIKMGAVLATEALLEVVRDKGHKDRVKAIDMMLNRAGLIVVSEQKVTVEHKPDPSTAEIVGRIRQIADRLGLDPRPMLLQAGVDQTIIDAEFEEVPHVVDREPSGHPGDDHPEAEQPLALPSPAGEPESADPGGADLDRRDAQPDRGAGEGPGDDDWSAL